MKKIVCIITLLVFTLSAHAPSAQMLQSVVNGSVCSLPTSQITSQWLAAPASACSTGYPCMNDAIGGNNATQSVSANAPSFTNLGIGAQPSVTFTLTKWLVLANPIPTSVTTYTEWVVFNASAVSTNYFFASSSSSAVGYRIGTTHQNITNTGVANIATGTTTYSTSTPYAIAMTYNNGTNAYGMYYATSGILNTDKTGSATALVIVNPITFIGNSGVNSITSTVAEAGFFNGIWSSTQLDKYATYVSCKYGI